MMHVRPDITLAYDGRGLFFKAHSARGNEFLRETFATITGDVSPTGMATIADKARMAGLIVAE